MPANPFKAPEQHGRNHDAGMVATEGQLDDLTIRKDDAIGKEPDDIGLKSRHN